MSEQTHKDLVAIVTGGNRGLGKIMAEALVAAGAKVLITGRDEAELSATIAGNGGKMAGIAADLTADDAPRKIVAAALDKFGGIDILVNNAGITIELLRRLNGGQPPSTMNLTADEFRHLFEVNVIAPFMLSREVIAPMRARGGGRIVNVTTSLDTMWARGMIPYGGSKAANEANSVALAKELQEDNITVNVLTPGGPAATQMISPKVDPNLLIPAIVMAAPLLWLTAPENSGVTATRVVAALWKTDLPPHEAAKLASAPAAWQSLGSQARNPEGFEPHKYVQGR
jgi:NAD(P)-dependent dehydrogenase (short-subunit alcohol dehydrogenase family)